MKEGEHGQVTPVSDHILLKQSHSVPQEVNNAILDISLVCSNGAWKESGLRCTQKRKQKGHF